ncbi:MAG: GAF domain-containing protein [Nitrospirae bacterium]|nr:GAF domain-containing protein [Nitrospirota bacterium]
MSFHDLLKRVALGRQREGMWLRIFLITFVAAYGWLLMEAQIWRYLSLHVAVLSSVSLFVLLFLKRQRMVEQAGRVSGFIQDLEQTDAVAGKEQFLDAVLSRIRLWGGAWIPYLILLKRGPGQHLEHGEVKAEGSPSQPLPEGTDLFGRLEVLCPPRRVGGEPVSLVDPDARRLLEGILSRRFGTLLLVPLTWTGTRIGYLLGEETEGIPRSSRELPFFRTLAGISAQVLGSYLQQVALSAQQETAHREIREHAERAEALRRGLAAVQETHQQSQTVVASLNEEVRQLHEQVQKVRGEAEHQICEATAELDRICRELDQREVRQQGQSSGDLLGASLVLEALWDETFLLEFFLLKALDELQAEIGSIMLLDEETGDLVIRASEGLDEAIVRQTRIPLGEAVSGYVVQERRPLLVADIDAIPDLARASRVQGRKSSFIAVPILQGEQAVGVLNVNQRRGQGVFTPEDLRVAEGIARQITSTLGNLKAFCDESGSLPTRGVTAKHLLLALTRRLRQRAMVLERKSVIQKAAILAVGIHGLSRAFKEHPVEQVISFLNGTLALLTPIVFQREGSLERYTGDGLFAIFGIPFAGVDDPERAVRAAIDMVVAFTQWKGEGQCPGDLGIGAGVVTAEVVLGEIGTEYDRRHAVVGEGMDLGRRLQRMAYPGQVLVDESTYSFLSGRVEARKVGSMTSTLGAPIEVYSILKFRA